MYIDTRFPRLPMPACCQTPIDRSRQWIISRAFFLLSFYQPLPLSLVTRAKNSCNVWNWFMPTDLSPSPLPKISSRFIIFEQCGPRKMVRDKLRHVDNEENGGGSIDSTLGWVMIFKKTFWNKCFEINCTVSFFSQEYSLLHRSFMYLLIPPFTYSLLSNYHNSNGLFYIPYYVYLPVYERRKKKVGKSWKLNFLYANPESFPSGQVSSTSSR